MNVDWLYHLPAPARRVLYFSLQRAIGSRISSVYADFLHWTRYNKTDLESAVEQRLRNLLTHASINSPYYRSLNISAKESSTDWLCKFPILTRSNVRTRFSELLVEALQAEIPNLDSKSKKRYDWLIVKTGGTTGHPTTVVHDAMGRDSGRATRLFAQKLSRFPLGTRYFRLWGSEQDLFEQKEHLDRRVLRNLLGEIPMNCFRAKNTDLEAHLRVLQSHPSVRHMMAYVDAAGTLSEFAQNSAPSLKKLQTVMACTGTVTPDLRKTITDNLADEVFDKYGSRECNDIACECNAHDGLHIFSPAVFIEIVDEAGNPVPPGRPGRILVTLLNNLSFPLVRYEIGDVGVFSPPADCPCGLSFPKLASIEGRSDDMLTTNDGAKLTSVFVRHMVGVSLNNQTIKEWQVEQTARNNFVFRYIPAAERGLESNLNAVATVFEKAVGPNLKFEFTRVNEIPLTSTGKKRWIINSAAT